MYYNVFIEESRPYLIERVRHPSFLSLVDARTANVVSYGLDDVSKNCQRHVKSELIPKHKSSFRGLNLLAETVD